MLKTKICKQCNKEKDIDNFYKDKNVKDGYRNKCKECIKINNTNWRKNNKVKVNNIQKDWRGENKEKIKSYNKKQYNSEKRKLYLSTWNKENPNYYKSYNEKK